jgi:hypothetical protein
MIDDKELSDFFKFAYDPSSSSESCDNNTLALYQDEYLQNRYEGGIIELKESPSRIEIHTDKLHSQTKVYLGRITRGNVAAFIAFDIEFSK